MSNGVVNINIVGNCAADPVVTFSDKGNAVCKFRVGVSYRVKDKSGVWGDKTDWYGVTCFGNDAKFAGEYLKKGQEVYAAGRLETGEWTDKDGGKRFSLDLVADRVKPLGGKAGAGTGKSNGGGAQQPSDDQIPF